MKVSCKIVDFLSIALVFINAIFLSTSLYGVYPQYAAQHDWYHVTHERCVAFFASQGFDVKKTWAAYENSPARCIEIQKRIKQVFKNLKESLDNEDSKIISFPEFLEEVVNAQPIVFNEKTNNHNQKSFAQLIHTRIWPLKWSREHYLFLENALEGCLLKFLTLKNKNGQMPLFDLVFASFKDQFENNTIVTGYLRPQKIKPLMTFKILGVEDDGSNNEQEFKYQEDHEEDDNCFDESTNFLTGGICVTLSITSGFIILVLAAGAEYLMHDL